MDFPIPPEFWWSTDNLSASIFLRGVDQKILPCGQGRIDSVKINPSLLMMTDCHLHVERVPSPRLIFQFATRVANPFLCGLNLDTGWNSKGDIFCQWVLLPYTLIDRTISPKLVKLSFLKTDLERGRTRTCNPQIRSLVPYPLGHTA